MALSAKRAVSYTKVHQPRATSVVRRERVHDVVARVLTVACVNVVWHEARLA